MDIRIEKVGSRKQLKQFVTFPLHLYKNCENWVPALEGDEYDTFNPEKNGAYDFCEADCFLAFRGNEIVGRVAAIINHKADDEQKLFEGADGYRRRMGQTTRPHRHERSLGFH